MSRLHIEQLPGEYVIARLAPGARYRPPGGAFRSVIDTPDETSIVCLSEHWPPNAVAAEAGWALLRLKGTFDLTLVGVLVAVLNPLADANIEIFALSTYNTDYLLVRSDRADDARDVLTANGHIVTSSDWTAAAN